MQSATAAFFRGLKREEGARTAMISRRDTSRKLRQTNRGTAGIFQRYFGHKGVGERLGNDLENAIHNVDVICNVDAQ